MKVLHCVTLSVLIGISSCGSAEANLFSDDDQLYLPSTGPPIKYNRIHTLSLGAGADPNVLAQPIKFTRVQGVGLGDSHSNVLYLKLLLQNYKHIEGLSLTQDEAVGSDSTALLKNFVRLRTLSLNCPLERPDELSSWLPLSLRTLSFGPSSNITDHRAASFEFPNIESLFICGCALTSSFVSSCSAPSTRKGELRNVRLESGTLKLFLNFPRLSRVEICYAAKFIDRKPTDFDSEIDNLRKHGIHVKVVQGY